MDDLSSAIPQASPPASASSVLHSLNASMPAAAPSTEGKASAAADLPNSEQERFEVELEFVQCLASPSYLHWLAQNQYLDDPDFIKYLSYLQYWLDPPYVQFIVFPHCLYFLRLLQKAPFRQALKRQDYTLFVHQQQGYFWQFGRTMKLREPGEVGVGEVPEAVGAATAAAAAETRKNGGEVAAQGPEKKDVEMRV